MRQTIFLLHPPSRFPIAMIIIVVIVLSMSAPSSGFVPGDTGTGTSVSHRQQRPAVNKNDGFESAAQNEIHRNRECIPKSGDCHHQSATNTGDAINPNDLNLLRRRNVLVSLMASSIPASMALPLFLDVQSADAAMEEEDASSSSSSAQKIMEEPNECKNGAIISESAVPGAYEQSCMNLDERSFPLKTPGGGTITVYQGSNTAGGVSGRTGVAVWNSGILLTRLLDELANSNPSIFANKTILELGCGTALASIASAKLGASSVVATDANTEVLALARRNIERNLSNNNNNNNVATDARTAVLQWGLMDASEYENVADVIIGSDLTYNSGSWVALSETMATVLKPGGIVIYLSLGHSGFNVGGEMGGFLSVVGNMGLQLLTKDSVEWKDNGIGGRSAEELVGSVITSEERDVIDSNGGVRVVFLGKKKTDVVVRKGYSQNTAEKAALKYGVQ